MTRKLWMTLGAMTLLLAAGAARADEQTRWRKDARHAMRHAHKAAREAGHREAKARAWRQIQAARDTMAASEWQAAFEDLASEVLVVAAELSQSGSHKAAMNLLQRVIDTVPQDADVTATLARIYDRGPRNRSAEAEESEASEQEGSDDCCYGFDFGTALCPWTSNPQEAAPNAFGNCCNGAPCGVPCTPCCAATAECTDTCACCKDCKCAKKKKKPIAGCTPAVDTFCRLTLSLSTGCPLTPTPENCCQACQPCSDAIPCDDCTPSTTEECPRVKVVSSQISQSATAEVQEVTVIRYNDEGGARLRQYQVTRTLSDDQQAVSRTERMTGATGRFVHQVSNDENGDFVQDLYDFVPCSDE